MLREAPARRIGTAADAARELCKFRDRWLTRFLISAADARRALSGLPTPNALPDGVPIVTIALARLQEADARQCAEAIAVAARTATTMEAAAGAACRWLYDELADSRGSRACVMVRCYLTHPYGALPADLQRFAKRALGAVAITPPEPGMRCLTLLATAGDEPAWNDRRQSQGHQAIPLPSPHIVERAPMIAQLIRELGLDIASVVRPGGARPPAGAASTEGVFHVEDAVGSPFIPAQQGFVARYGIRSVVGFGGLLPSSSELFAIIAFSRDHVPVVTADAFRTVAGVIGRVLAQCGRTFDESLGATG